MSTLSKRIVRPQYCWFHCSKAFIPDCWLLYAGRTIISKFPNQYQAYKKRRYLQSLLDNFKFDQVRVEINLLLEDLRDGD